METTQSKDHGFQIHDESDLRKYRTEIPNIVDDLPLSAYARSLYMHLKRVCGAGGGKCWKGERALAAGSGMSKGSVRKAKAELEEARPELHGKSLIQIEPGNPVGKTGFEQSDKIIIVDVWPENFASFTPPVGVVATKPPPGRLKTTPRSPHDQGGPDKTRGGRHTTIRINTKKKEPIKKQQQAASPNPTGNAPPKPEDDVVVSKKLGSEEVVQELVACGMSRPVAVALSGEYSAERVRRHVRYFRKHRGSIRGVGWLVDAIKENHQYVQDSGWMTADEVQAHARKRGIPARHPDLYQHNGKIGREARWKFKV